MLVLLALACAVGGRADPGGLREALLDEGLDPDAPDVLLPPELGDERPARGWSLRTTPSGTTLRLGAGRAGLRGRLRADDDGGVLWSSRAAVGFASASGGRLRLDHGLGLLAMGAGRWSRLGASSSLPAARSGVSSYLGLDPRRAVVGGAVRLGANAVALQGRTGDAAVPVAAVVLGARGARLLAVDGGGARGVSLHLGRRGDEASWDVEAASGGRGRTAVAARAAWRGSRAAVEATAVAGDATGGVLASGLPYGAGVAGTAWAMRSRWRPVRGASLSALVARSESREARATGLGVRVTDRFELRGACGLGGGVRADARISRRGGRRLGRADVRPWEPPAVENDDRDWTVAAGLAGRRGDWSYAGRLARRMRTVDGEAQDRHVVQLRLERRFGRDAGVRLVRTRAWGGALDLTVVDVPAPGLAVVRHARHLRDAVGLGAMAKAFGLELSAALDVAVRDDRNGPSTTLRIRLRGGG